MKIPILVIAGPTAVGKTDFSIQIAKDFHGEIINGDSLQFYQGLDIGTGKILSKEMQGISHHMLDFLPPEATYDVSQFVVDAHAKIERTYQNGHLPIIVGGSGLYIEGLLYEMSFGHENSHHHLMREQLQQLHQKHGDLYMWQQLQMKDPKAAENIPYQNVRRVIRALEVIEATGKKFSEQFDQAKGKNRKARYDALTLILDRPRDLLYDRINRRVLAMVQSGLEKEVYDLYQIYADDDLQSLKAIGYKEWFPYFRGEVSKESVIETIQQNSRRYAKRQLTWFRNRLEDTHWIDVSDEENAMATISKIIQKHLKK